jgi:hypothetical protein
MKALKTKKVKALFSTFTFFVITPAIFYALPDMLSDTVNLFLPFARRDANTLRPLALSILLLKPCLFTLFLFEGWNVLFIAAISFFSYSFESAKLGTFFDIPNFCLSFREKVFYVSVNLKDGGLILPHFVWLFDQIRLFLRQIIK